MHRTLKGGRAMQYQEYQLDAKALSADSLLLHSLLTGLLGALLL